MLNDIIEFKKSVDQVRAVRPDSLDNYSIDEYLRMKVYHNLTRTIGFALDGDNLVSLHSTDIKGLGKLGVIKAIREGARNLECYDYLEPYYSGFCFERTGADWL